MRELGSWGCPGRFCSGVADQGSLTSQHSLLSLGLPGRTTVAVGLTMIGLVAVASPVQAVQRISMVDLVPSDSVETVKKWLIAFAKTAASRAK